VSAQRKLAVDASVALKWQLTDEENIIQALALRNSYLQGDVTALLAPTLIYYEISNILVVSLRRNRLRAGDIRFALDNMLDLGLEVREPDWQRTCDLAFEHSLSAYDASYLAIAEVEGCPLWTGDRRLYEAVRRGLPWVRWIGDY
jgi:predicted nucleic acid-binding protein